MPKWPRPTLSHIFFQMIMLTKTITTTPTISTDQAGAAFWQWCRFGAWACRRPWERWERLRWLTTNQRIWMIWQLAFSALTWSFLQQFCFFTNSVGGNPFLQSTELFARILVSCTGCGPRDFISSLLPFWPLDCTMKVIWASKDWIGLRVLAGWQLDSFWYLWVVHGFMAFEMHFQHCHCSASSN